jgi:hypothetical protein
MSAVIRQFRAYQSAAEKFKAQPNVYRSLVRAITAEQRAGRNGFAPVHQAKRATDEPKGAA